MESVFDKKVLLLDSRFKPIRIITVRGAIHLLFREVAQVMNANWERFSADEWLGKTKEMMKQDSNLKVIRSVDKAFALPDVICLTEFKMTTHASRCACNKKNIVLRDHSTCQYCGTVVSLDKASIDHVLPRSRNGQYVWTNVVTSCVKCNQAKGDKTPEEWGRPLKKKPTSLKWDVKFIKEVHSKMKNENQIWRNFL
jgi:5-methylcytosine-specific restriction endonuclease McrA